MGGRTHHEGCWSTSGHHDCAIRYIEQLSAKSAGHLSPNWGDVAVFKFDCGCELRIFPRDREGGLLFGYGSCPHKEHDRPLLETLQYCDGILLTSFQIVRAEPLPAPPEANHGKDGNTDHLVETNKVIKPEANHG